MLNNNTLDTKTFVFEKKTISISRWHIPLFYADFLERTKK
jgi:hypothetical protein